MSNFRTQPGSLKISWIASNQIGSGQVMINLTHLQPHLQLEKIIIIKKKYILHLSVEKAYDP